MDHGLPTWSQNRPAGNWSRKQRAFHKKCTERTLQAVQRSFWPNRTFHRPQNRPHIVPKSEKQCAFQSS